MGILAMEPILSQSGVVPEDSTSIVENDCGVPSNAIVVDFVEVPRGWYEASTCNSNTDVETALAVFSTSCSNLQAQGGNVQGFSSTLFDLQGSLLTNEQEELTSNECLTVSAENDAGCATVSFYSSGPSCVVVLPKTNEGNYQVDVFEAPTPPSNYLVTGENTNQEEISVNCVEYTGYGALHDFALPAGDYVVSTCHEATEMSNDIVILDGTCDQFRDLEVACVASSICPAQEEEPEEQAPEDQIPDETIGNNGGGLININLITIPLEVFPVVFDSGCQPSECPVKGTTVSFSLDVGRNICVVTLFDDTGKYELSVEKRQGKIVTGILQPQPN